MTEYAAKRRDFVVSYPSLGSGDDFYEEHRLLRALISIIDGAAWKIVKSNNEPLEFLFEISDDVSETDLERLWRNEMRFSTRLDSFFECRLGFANVFPQINRPTLEDALSHLDKPISMMDLSINERESLRFTGGRESVFWHVTQIRSLVRALGRISEAVHPTNDNMDTYGHEIRNLLLIACTEVEALWRSVLESNGYKRGRMTTNDYVKLSAPLKLMDYELRFSEYPWITPVCPFADWRVGGSPTDDLPWYSAYNHAKHDAFESFNFARLRFAFDAVAACIVMMHAQYGMGVITHYRDLFDFFDFAQLPTWDIRDWYVFPSSSWNSWRQVPYSF